VKKGDIEMIDLKKFEILGDFIHNSEEFNKKIELILEELKNLIELHPKYNKIEFILMKLENLILMKPLA